MTHPKWHLDPGRFFDPDPTQRRLARALYESVADLPLICPHGHVDPWLFADEDATFSIPAELLLLSSALPLRPGALQGGNTRAARGCTRPFGSMSFCRSIEPAGHSPCG